MSDQHRHFCPACGVSWVCEGIECKGIEHKRDAGAIQMCPPCAHRAEVKAAPRSDEFRGDFSILLSDRPGFVTVRIGSNDCGIEIDLPWDAAHAGGVAMLLASHNARRAKETARPASGLPS